MDKARIKLVAQGAAVVCILSLFLLNYGKASVLGYNVLGFSFFDLASNESILLWLVLLSPIAFLVVPFVKEQVAFVKKQEAMLYLAIPAIGFVWQIISWLILKKMISDMAYGAAGTSAAIGFYLVALSFIVMFVCSLITAKGQDFGNEKVNNFINKASDSASKMTEKAVVTVEKKVHDIKQNREEKGKEVVEDAATVVAEVKEEAASVVAEVQEEAATVVEEVNEEALKEE